jgi:uncharacterized metal-binding protein YceD (DUF177 family)
MSQPETPEFSYVIKLDELGRLKDTLHIEADVDQCAALARRFSFDSLLSLSADFAVSVEGKAVFAKGRVRAALTQICIATGDPVPENVDEPFTVRFMREGEESIADDEMELDAQEIDTVLYEGDRIDLGEAVAETLALSVDPYPRSPHADTYLKEKGVVSEEQAGPFAALAALRKS